MYERPPGYRVVSALPGAARVEASGRTLEAATQRLRELAAEGIPAALLPDAAACAAHPAELARGTCRDCGGPCCAACAAAAGGASRCARCASSRARARQARQLRDSVALLGFALFLYGVSRHLRAEAAALEPPVRVLIAQFVPPRLADDPRVRALNTPDGGAGRALTDIAPFYARERTRWTGAGGAPLVVTLPAPVATDIDPPPVPGRGARWAEAVRAWTSARYFHRLADRHGLAPDAYGARIYVVWTDAPGDVTSDSRGSRTGRLAIVHLTTADPNPGYAVIAVAHELAHVLGAGDTYAEADYLARWPEGYAEPFASPPWPQPFAELMAVDRPTGPHTEQEVSGLGDVRVGAATAAGMGWLDPAVAADYYEAPAARRGVRGNMAPGTP